MGIRELPVRKEVFEGIDPSPKLGKILQVFEGREPEDLSTAMLSDAKEFFKRTFITDNMLKLFEKVVDSFEGKGKRTFALYSFYGGGKTHTLLALIHAFRDPDALLDKEVVKDLDVGARAKLEEIVERIKRLGVKIVPFAGEVSEFSGSPLNPTDTGSYAYRTIWGYLAHKLGKFQEYADADRTLTAPQQDVIEKMLAGEKVLFVFDELFDYLMHFIGGEYRNYAMTGINFIEYFIQAVKKSKCVAVLTLPVDAKGNMDYRYEVLQEGELEKLNTSLWNTLKDNAELIEPISTMGTDVVNVLKKRLFEDIPDLAKDRAIQRLKEKVENYISYFDSVEFVEKARETYPFSPDYVEVLQDLIIRVKLQKTRDALEMSMRVLRETLQSGFDPDFIMPFHINLTWFDNVFRGYSEYEQIYVKQVESYASPRFGELPKYILRTIFISTFHYDSAVPIEAFPTRRDIVRMVYEPATFSVNNLEVPDVDNAINEILASSEVTHLNEKDGKLWFWRYPNIKEYINKRARRILEDNDPEIYAKIEEYVNLGLRGTLDKFAAGKVSSTKGKKGKTTLPSHAFEDTFVIRDFDDYPSDNRRLKLAILLRPDLVNEVEDILKNFENSQRSYKNTLVILSPADLGSYTSRGSWPEEYKELMEKAAGLIAAERILEEIYTLYGDYGEDAVSVQKTIVDKEIARYKAEVAGMIPRAFTYVIYLAANGEVVATKIVSPNHYLPYAVHETLSMEDKLVEDLDFEYFSSILRDKMQFDLENSDSMKTVQQIVDWFLQDPGFPMVKEKTVKDTIARGVRMLRIGLLRKKDDREEVYFKPVHDSKPVTQDVEGKVPSQILDNDGVLSRKRAIEEQFRVLKSRQTEVTYPTHIERIYYVVYTGDGDSHYTLDQLETLPDWREAFYYGVIVRVVEKVSKDLILDIYPASVQKVKPGEKANFIIQARPINLNIESLKIAIRDKSGKTVLDATPSPEKTEMGLVYRTEFEIEPEERVEEFEVEAIPVGEQEKSKKAKIKVLVEDEKKVVTTKEIGMEHVGYHLLRIDNVVDFGVVEELRDSIVPLGRSKVNGKVFGTVRAMYAGGKLELIIEDMDLEVGVDAAVELAGYGDEKSISHFRVEFSNTVLDELLVRKLETLNGRALFTLRREE